MSAREQWRLLAKHPEDTPPGRRPWEPDPLKYGSCSWTQCSHHRCAEKIEGCAAVLAPVEQGQVDHAPAPSIPWLDLHDGLPPVFGQQLRAAYSTACSVREPEALVLRGVM